MVNLEVAETIQKEHHIGRIKKSSQHNQEQYLQQQLDNGPSLKRYRRFDSDDERERNAELFSAIRKGNLQNVVQLLDSGVQVNIIDRNNKDNTPLHYAIEKGNKEIVEQLLLQKWKTEINGKNNKGDTPLHIATYKGNKELMQLLLNNQAKIDIQNNEGTTPLKLAQNQEIINILKTGSSLDHNDNHILSQPGSSSDPVNHKKGDINERLEEFVKFFVSQFEEKLTNYYDEVSPGKKTRKAGKMAEGVNQVSGALAAIPVAGKAIAILGKPIKYFDEKKHREKAKRVIEVFRHIEKEDTRKAFVKAGGDIFKIFESQFIVVTDIDGGWVRAMGKLAVDAMDRAINYIDHKKKDPSINIEVSVNLITKGVIFGTSKEGIVATLVPAALQKIPKMPKPGRTVQDKDSSKEWKTSELYEETGILKVEGDFIEYYKKKGSNTKKYGYRLPLEWELEEWKEFKLKYEIGEKPSREVKYILKSEEIKEKLENILDKINKEDPIRKLNRIGKGIEENQQILEKLEKSQKEIKHGVHVLLGRQQVKDKEPVRFGVKEPVIPFTGRAEQLNKITTDIQQGIVVINGLPGVGKSELAIKYAHDHSKDYEGNVIWINAGTQEALKESFHRLSKEKLKISIKDIDGEKKNIKSIVEATYEYFADRKSLFIFDNVEMYAVVEEFLLLNLPNNANKPKVLITSSNSEWKSTRVSIKGLALEDFSDTEAMGFIKNALKIENDLQNEDIANLVKKLHNFPLALQQAVAYIKGTNEAHQKRNSEFKVSDYNNLLSSESGTYEEILSKTWEITFKKLKEEQHSKEALYMLNIMSYLAPNQIPEKMFLSKLADGNQQNMIPITSSLEKYSIVRLAKGMLSIHGLVQNVRRLELKGQQEEGKSLEETTLEEALTLLKKYMEDRNSKEDYIPHAISVWNYASKYDNLVESFIVNSNIATSSIPYFHLIAENSNSEVVETILSKINGKKLRSIITTKSEDGKTPLHYAAQSGNEQVVKLLIERKANVDTYDKIKNTPLHLAAKSGYLEIVKVLLDTNRVSVDAETSSKYEFTPLHFAARNGHLQIVKVLLEKGANVNAKTKYEFTPLHLAAANGHYEIVSELLKDGKIEVNAETKLGLAPLHLAVENGHIEVVKVLLEKSASINAQDVGNFTPLHLAAQNGHLDIVKLLIDKGAHIDAQTTKGNTALHLAAENNHLKVVQALLTKSANIDIENEEGKTAFNLATERDNSEVKDYIRQQTMFNRRPGTSGISGQLYEINLLMLFLLQGSKGTSSFYLATNVKEAGDFDDVVFKYESGTEKSKIVFLQAKHRENPEKDKITIEQLFSESEKGDFNLKKYFNSYRIVKQQFSEGREDKIFGSKFKDVDFIIYTNALSSFSKNKESIEKVAVEQDDILNLSEKSSSYYKLIANDDESNRKRISVLQYSSDCKRLAKELAESFSKQDIVVNEGILRDYHIPLAGEVIQKKEGESEGNLRGSFLNSDSQFRSAFFEEMRKRSEFAEKSEDELKSELQNKRIRLSDNFGRSKTRKGKYPEFLPNDLVSEAEIKEFLSRLKLFVNQPNEKELSKCIKQKIQKRYKVEQQNINSVFSEVEYKVKKWWQSGNNYLRKDNKFFEDAARISINFDVKEPVTLFTGRITELENLHKILKGRGEAVISQMVSVTGLGGIGKSELARKYISEHNNEYDNNIIWLNADNYLTIARSFRRLAQYKLRISTTDENGKEKEIKLIVEDVYRFFAKRRSLFVFDNAGKHKAIREGEEAEGVDKFLPSGPNKPHVLITSRDKEWGEIKSLPLGVFTEEDAIEFIKKALNGVVALEENEVKGLAEELQYLPLALKQAVAYIKVENQRLNKWEEGKFTIGSYLEQFKEKANELLSRETSETHDRYTDTVITTWQITINKIRQKKLRGGEQALEILGIMAYLAPDKIPVDEIFSKLIGDEGLRHSAVELIDQYSMSNLDAGKLNIHRLVQQVTRINLKEQNKEEEVIGKALELFKSSINSNSIDHAVSAWNHASKYEELVRKFSGLPSQIIDKLNNAIRYEEAYLFGSQVLELLRNMLGSSHLDTINVLHNTALVLKNQGKYQKALQTFKEVLDKGKADLGDNNPVILSAKYNIASILRNQGNYDEALQDFKEVFTRRDALLGYNNLDTLRAEHSIALTLGNQGNYDASLQAFKKVLSAFEQVPESEEEILRTKYNIATVVFYKQGKYDEALPILEEVFNERKSILGENNIDTLKAQNMIALVLDDQGEYNRALEIFREVFDKRKLVLGSEHPDTLGAQSNIAAVLRNQGKYEEASQIFKEVLDFQEATLGENDPRTLRTKNNMGVALKSQGKYDEALQVFKELYDVQESVLDESFPGTLPNNIALTLYEQAKYDEALTFFRKVYEERKKRLGDNNRKTLDTLTNIALMLTKQGNYNEALKIYQEIFEKQEGALGEYHSLTLTAKDNMAYVLEQQGKYDEALKIFQEQYQKRKEKLGESHSDTRETKTIINRLSQLLGSSGEHEIQMAAECLPSTSHRKKREAAGECLFTWEDVDEFNAEKDDKRDFSKIKIGSDKFIDYIKDLPERKRSQLIQLADKVKVTGKSQGLIHKLTNNRRVMSHLAKVGKISGMTMHGLMTKNVLADFLNGEYQGVAINVGFIAGGQGFAKVAEAASIKGLKLASEGKLLLGRSLRAVSPFLARGTSAFVIYDLVNQVKAFKNGTEEALVGIIGDSIYLGVDAAEIGIEIAEAFELLEGMSSVTGPIGAAIGAVVFVGTDIYMAVKRVDKIDQIIHLKGSEKFIEGLRASIGLQPEKHIEELLEEKQLYSQLVKQEFKYLLQHSDIQSYVFPTGKSVVDSCKTVPHTVSICVSGGFNGCSRARTVTSYTEKCTTKFEQDLDNTVVLDEKRADIKWSRAKPDNPRGSQLFCLPKGSYRLAPSYGSYLCKSTIGITDLSANKTGSYTLINLGEGEDYAKGFIDSPNIFVVNRGSKKYFGGNKDDMFIVQGTPVKGYFYGEGGVNTLDLTSFASEEESIDVKLHIGQVEDYYRYNIFGMSGINKFLGRRSKADQVFIACDGANDVQFVDGQGGSDEFVDHINILDKDCTYKMQIVIRPNTVVYNRALEGNFHYTVPYGLGSTKIDFLYSKVELNLYNTFTFEYEPVEIKNIDARDVNTFNNTLHTIHFNFAPMSDKEFNITISGASNPSYRLGNNTEIKVGNKGNLYMLENTNKSVNEIIKDYLIVANRLNKMSFFIQSLLSNETVVIGSGNYEIIHNNPLHKSHLIGNGGENVYVIDSQYKVLEVNKLPIPEVTIYDFDAESSVDTIDLRNLVQQARSKFSNNFELQVLKSANDFFLKATITKVKTKEDLSVSTMRKHEYFTVRLKDGVNWYNKTHVIIDSAPMKINLDNNKWSLKPQPLMFEKDKEVIVVTSRDVEENTELITPKRAGNYTFVRDLGVDLIITNTFDAAITKEDFCTITLSKFYAEPKMETLSIKFADKKVTLKNHQEQISSAREMNVVAKEYKDQVYNDVFNPTESSPEVIMLSDPSTSRKHRYEHNRQQKTRHRRSDNITSSGTRTSSWINDMFGWMKVKSSLLTSSIVNPIGRWFIDDQDINASSQNKFHNSSTQNHLKAVDFSQVYVNGTILLADVLLAQKGRRRIYSSSMDQCLSQSQTLGYTLNIGQVFEEALKKAALKSGISERRLNIDFVEIEKMEKKINNKVVRGRFDEISNVLKSYAEKVCPNSKKGSVGMLSRKKFNKFMDEFNNLSLSQSIEQILHNSKNNAQEDNNVQKQQINSNLENKKPKSYLDIISAQGYLTQVRDLM